MVILLLWANIILTHSYLNRTVNHPMRYGLANLGVLGGIDTRLK